MKPAFREKNQRGEDGGKWWAVSAPAIAGERCAEAGDVARRSGARFPESAGQRAIGIARNIRRTRVARRGRGRITSSIRVGRRAFRSSFEPPLTSRRERGARRRGRTGGVGGGAENVGRVTVGRKGGLRGERDAGSLRNRAGGGGGGGQRRSTEWSCRSPEKHHTHCGVSFFPEAMHRPRDARVRLTRGAKTPARSRRRRRRCASSRRRRARGERCPGLGS
jgi:hypothetical protein